MNKPELLEILSKDANITKAEANEVLASLSNTIRAKVLIGGDQISIPGLGIFKQKQSAGRMGRNPATGQPLEIPAKVSVSFKASKGSPKDADECGE